MTGTVTWVSDAPAVATVSSTGVVTAVGNGSTTVRASSGGLSASVEVTVQQVVTSLTVVAGNDQSAIAGEPLAESVVVRTRDQGGAAVAGVTVTFTPDEGSGIVSVDLWHDGRRRAWPRRSGRWVRRSDPSASRPAWSRRDRHHHGAKPIAGPPAGPGHGRSARSCRVSTPARWSTITVQVSVRNDGDASTDQAFRVRLLSDGEEIASQEVAAMAPAASETLAFEVGPFDVGPHALTPRGGRRRGPSRSSSSPTTT